MKIAIRFACLLFFLYVGQGLSAQLSQEEILYDGIMGFRTAEILDLNNDSIQDVVFVTRSLDIPYDRVGGLYKGIGYYDGEGLAFRIERIDTGRFNNDIHIIDMDLDGDKDLVVETFYDNECYFLYENEGAQFHKNDQLPDFLENTCIDNLIAQDLNNDGKTDFISHHEYGFQKEHIKIHYHTSAGEFDTHEITSAKAYYNKRDFNKDGIIDYIIADLQNDNLYLYLSNSQFSFEEILLDSTFNKKNIHHIGDIDYDGKDEIVLGFNYKMYAIHDLHLGQDMPEKEFLFPNRYYDGIWIDVNLDGYIDNYHHGDSLIWYNEGDGNFTSSFEFLPIGYFDWIYSDSDISEKKAQYISKTNIDLTEWNYENNIWRSHIIPFNEVCVRSVDDAALKDINNDGYPELFFCSRWGHTVSYLEGLPGKKFGKLNPVAHDELGAYDLTLADFNGDGLEDVLYSSIWTGNVIVKYGDGKGGFNNKTYLIEDWGLVRGSEAIDLDNDSFPDILVSSLSAHEVRLIRNVKGEFQEVEVIASGEDFEEFVKMDIDLDGDIDILVENYGPSSQAYFIFKNNGEGELTMSNDVIYSRNEVHFADFDKDGIEEIVTSSGKSVLIDKITTQGLEPWMSIDVTPILRDNFYFLVLDYNGDGYLDILVENQNPEEIKLYKNIKNDHFEYDDIFESKFGFRFYDIYDLSALNVDIDGDGDRDVLYSEDYKLKCLRDLRGDISISGKTYIDNNLDSTFNSGDQRLESIRVTAVDSAGNQMTTYSNSSGEYHIFVSGGEFELTAFSVSDCLESIVSTPMKVVVANSDVKNANIGFVNDGTEKSDILTSLSRGPTRCGFDVRYYVSIINNGCKNVYGNGVFQLDNKVDSFESISLEEYSIEGNKIQFSLDSLLPGESIKFNLLVQIPSVEFFGELLSDSVTLKFDHDYGNQLDKTYTQRFISGVTCAVDPNDKIAHPDRREVYDKQYIEQEDILYTIRFQNTGNDTAFNVRLLDTISEKLDLASFQPVDASHDHRVTMDEENRELKVEFDHILLPDSSVNYEGSNGFFTFRIHPSPELEDYTSIYNSAGIYFDFNPPIVTNSHRLDYVSDLEILSSLTRSPPIDSNMYVLYPNPVLDVLNVKNSYNISSVSIYNTEGRQILSRKQWDEKGIDVGYLPSGVYFLHLHTAQKSIKKRFVIVK